MSCEIVELAANLIKELAYAQCDVNGDKFLILKMFVDHRQNDSAPSVEDQKIVVKEEIPYKVSSWLVHLLQVEGKLDIMEEVIQSQEVAFNHGCLICYSSGHTE